MNKSVTVNYSFLTLNENQNKMSELDKLKSELKEVTKVHDDAYDRMTELREKIHKLENQSETEEINRATRLFQENKFIQLSDKEVTYVDHFNDLSAWDEKWYIDGSFIVFNKTDEGDYHTSDNSEICVGYLSEVKSLKPVFKGTMIDIINKSKIKGLIKSLE